MIECPRCHTLNPDDEDTNYCRKCNEPLRRNGERRGRKPSTGLCDGIKVPRSGGF